jgi:hypothetical protein
MRPSRSVRSPLADRELVPLGVDLQVVDPLDALGFAALVKRPQLDPLAGISSRVERVPVRLPLVDVQSDLTGRGAEAGLVEPDVCRRIEPPGAGRPARTA